MSSFFRSFAERFTPIVKAEDEEAELVDPQTVLREKCSGTKECSKFKEVLDTCNDRVNSRSQTAETCVEEVIDFMSCIDHCAAKTLFHHLK
ncbi:cytochrome b-c1 complex subunit 6, mitochondrial [Copidosoma floridanum]|uniref:cytochrome b-c1 complex subunit 6, mitochondrial n=1 Tax=Copidosoma floridanum TaxID=29053 RepID=UPI0006C98646|nr:cytochrome b-c1 complex subunit 6, mitochondrial [Copidosoma floridanum]